MQFNGTHAEGHPDNIHIMANIKLNGLSPAQQEIQRQEDCYHGRLFEPADERDARRQKEWGTKWDPRGNAIDKKYWKPRYVISLPKKIVRAHKSKLFSADSYPNIAISSNDPNVYSDLTLDPEIEDAEVARQQAANDQLQLFINTLMKQAKLKRFMQQSCPKILVQGKVPVLVGVWAKRFCLERLDRKFSEIQYHEEDQELPVKLIEQYVIQETDKLTGVISDYLHRREVDNTAWREWKKLLDKKTDQEKLPKLTDADLTLEYEHNLGFCPVVSIETPDGESIFSDEVVENIKGLIEQDNDIKTSLRNNLDPQRYILQDPSDNAEDLAVNDGDPLEGESNSVLEAGTIWPLKARAVGDFSTQGSHEESLKDRANTINEIMESCQVVQIPEDNDQSGKAVSLRLEPMKSAAQENRASIGEEGLGAIILMMIRIAQRLEELGHALDLPPDVIIPKQIEGNQFELGFDWGEIFPPDEADKEKAIFNAASAKREKLISKKTAVRYVSSYFGVSDPEAELALIDQEQEQEQAALAASIMGGQHGTFNN